MDSNLGIEMEVIQDAMAASIEAVPQKPGELNIRRSSSRVVMAFPVSWSPEDWLSKDSGEKPFGETQIDRKRFPSLRRIGKDLDATVNGAFMERFLRILDSGTFGAEVTMAVKNDEQIVFTGHSSGGPIAVYATVWFLEEQRLKKKETPRVFCLTFGSPLTTDQTFCHAIQREGWSNYFVHFVTKLDIIPRILFAPPSSTRELLKEIVSFSDPHTTPVSTDHLTPLFVNVMKNASCAANYAACEITGSKHTVFGTMSRFIKLSPYRPCGKYVFCMETGESVVVENPDAVLQLLFYYLQIESETELQNRAEDSLKAALRKRAEDSLRAHWTYKDALVKRLATHNVVFLKKLQELPLSSDDAPLNDLNLCESARLCLSAAGHLEQKKRDNQRRIEGKKGEIKKALDALEKYRTTSKDDGVGYYDAFKLQKKEEDFKANVKRLEIVAIWEEIIEMIRRRELPDGFEADKEWVDLGTRFRQLVEPIDIANYYRHSRDDVAGHYMVKGRPSLYKYTQRWQEHAEQLPKDSRCESYFWAKVEELKSEVTKKVKPWHVIESKVLDLENSLEIWFKNKEDKSDMFLKNSTLVEWWQTLPEDHRRASCIKKFMPTKNSAYC